MLKNLLNVFALSATLCLSTNVLANTWQYLETEGTNDYYLHKESIKTSLPYVFATIVAASTTYYDINLGLQRPYWKGELHTSVLVNCSSKRYIELKKISVNSAYKISNIELMQIEGVSWKPFDYKISRICSN